MADVWNQPHATNNGYIGYAMLEEALASIADCLERDGLGVSWAVYNRRKDNNTIRQGRFIMVKVG